MNYKARIEVDRRVKENFAPELKELKKRTIYTVSEKKGKTVFEITAKDAVGLKIAANSIAKMLEVIEKMERV